RLPQIQTYLQMNERALPVRAAWLAWSAWAKAAGGDVLTLARARDRLLARLLDQGLNPEADLPAFLRFAGRPDADLHRSVCGWVEERRIQLQKWLADQLKTDPARKPTA